MNILIFNLNFNLSPFTYNDTLYFSGLYNTKVLCEFVKIDDRFNQDNIIKFYRDNNTIKAKTNSFLISHDLRLSYKNKNLRKQFKKIIEDFKPDLIQCHFGDEALVLLDNIEIGEVPIIIMFHGYDASAWIRNKTYVNKYKEIFNNKNISAICCSNNMKERLSAKGFPEEKLFVEYYGVDLNYYSRQERNKTEIKTYTQIAVFRGKKGIEQTIKAFSLFKERYNKNFKLILGGDGPLKKSIEELVVQLGLEDNVEFPGWLHQQQVKDLLNSSDVFVYHSVTPSDGDMEGIPNSIIEAMAMGLPIISTYHSGIPELVINNKNGILVEENDINGYAEAVNSIYSSGIMHNNINRVAKNFNLAKRNVSIKKYFIKVINEAK